MAAAAIAEERAEDEPGEHVYVPSAASQSHDASSSPAIAALTPRSSHLALAAGDGRVRIFSTGSATLVQQLTSRSGHLDSRHSALCWLHAPNERSCSSEGIGSLAVGTERGDVAAFDASLGQQLWCLEKGHSGRVCSLYHSKSNAVLYSAGADGIVLELSPSSGSVLHRFKVSKRKLSCMSIQRDGSRMLTGASKLTLWRMGDRKVERKFTGHMQPPHLARFDPSGTFAATASPGESSVVMWDLRTSGETQQSSQGNKKRRQSSSNASSSVGMCESFAVLWLNHPAYGIELSSASPKRNSDTSTKMDVNIAVTSAVGEVYIWTCRPPDKPGGVRKVRLGDGVKETLLFARALGNEVLLIRGLISKPEFSRMSLDVLEHDTVLPAQENGVIFSKGNQSLAKPKAQVNEQRGDVHLLGREAAAEAQMPRSTSKKRAASEVLADASEPAHAASGAADDADELGDLDVDRTMEEGNEQVEKELSLWERIRELEIQHYRRKDVGEGQEEEEAFRRSLPAGRAPRADSLSTLLSQALRADDRALLERCMSVSDESVIKRTVAALNSDEAVAFLALIVERLNARPHHGLHLSRWIKGVLCKHASYLIAAPQAKSALTALYQIVESRVSLLKPLLQLSGRLDLLLSQRETTNSRSDTGEDPAPPLHSEKEFMQVGDQVKPVARRRHKRGVEHEETHSDDEDDEDEEEEDEDEGDIAEEVDDDGESDEIDETAGDDYNDVV